MRPVQERIVRDLVAGDVRLVAIDTRFDDTVEPNARAIGSDVHRLDRFLAVRYRPVASFGSVTILRRNDLVTTPARSSPLPGRARP